MASRKISTKPLVVGITGIDTSGKSQMTELIERKLLANKNQVQVIHVDDFHRPRIERYQTHLPEPEQYFHYNFNFEQMASELLSPIRNQGHLEKSLTLLDLLSDTFTLNRHFVIDESTIVLVEGVFLFRPEIRDFIDFFIFLEISEETVFERAQIRDVPIYGEEFLEKYERKYLPGQRAYLLKYPPREFADVVIGNDDWNNPKILMAPLE